MAVLLSIVGGTGVVVVVLCCSVGVVVCCSDVVVGWSLWFVVVTWQTGGGMAVVSELF